MKDTGLTNNDIGLLNQVFSKYEDVQKVILYGSRAKGTFRNSSDIDLTLIGDNIPLDTLFSIENDLDDLLLPYKIDLSIYGKIDNIQLKEHIKRVGVTIYDRSTYPFG